MIHIVNVNTKRQHTVHAMHTAPQPCLFRVGQSGNSWTTQLGNARYSTRVLRHRTRALDRVPFSISEWLFGSFVLILIHFGDCVYFFCFNSHISKEWDGTAHGLTGSTARHGTARRHRYGTRQLRWGHRGESTHSSENFLWTTWCEHEVTSNSQVWKELRGTHSFWETNLFCCN